MLNRRQFLENTLKSSSLVAFSTMVPEFLANTARAAAPGKDTILVVLEMAGGNDGLNTVIPYGDDLYHKARPTIGHTKKEIVRIDDHLGLNPGMRGFDQYLQKGQLAILQGVGYPNPNRSHFESMDIWQSGDPRSKISNGWLGRSLNQIKVAEGQMPAIHIGTADLPLALQGSPTAVPSIHTTKPYDLNLGGQPPQPLPGQPFAPVPTAPPPPPGGPGTPKKEPTPEEKRRQARRQLIQDLAKLPPATDSSMLQFVQRSELQTYTTIDRLREITRNNRDEFRFYNAEVGRRFGQLSQDLGLVARLVQAGFGTRIFFVAIDGFDTHAKQQQQHQQLLGEVANAVSSFFNQLQSSGHADRVVLMTFSEFGRRVKENGSKGTDHGAASCLFVAGPAVKGGVVGKHPNLDDLSDGDLKFHTDFRQVYATLLDDWLNVPSEMVLGGKFGHVPLLKKA